MESAKIRDSFIKFFENKEHQIVSSASMVIKDDPTLMFTNAGMNQFKDLFLGNSDIKDLRVANTQKCLRVSGKHNDLEEVGHDTYHHTMFEMLGNWSFGDYFKSQSIDWAWEFLTEVCKLDKNRLYVTVFEGDDGDKFDKDMESFTCWKKHLKEDRILNGDKRNNFWEMGEIGPCGPCSEIHYDNRDVNERRQINGALLVNKDHPEVIEIWNLVFMQYNRKLDSSLELLPNKHVDTGMGFERLCMIMQNVKSNYDTDVFIPIISEIEKLSNLKYGNDKKIDIAMRVISDHIRAISFSISDGQLPSNVKAGYVIRRILRRAVRYAYTFLDLKEAFMYKIVDVLCNQMKGAFPELSAQKELIERVIKEEENSFLRTLSEGLKRLAVVMNNTKKVVSGNKYDKDVKSIMPIVEQINKEFSEFQYLSNDDLRDKTLSLKIQVSEFTASKREEVENLKKEAESDISPEEKENLYEKIDKAEEEIIKQTEEVLDDILPTAFAIVKETARRFTENETITVLATEFDKDLSATKDFVSIEENNAIYKNSWKAAGNEAKWEMIHYDVQLIGGVVMHQGKIAEMQTGEGKTLSATLPVFLNALAGLGVHLITVNNYLAKRDAEWMGPIFQFHGLSVDCIDNHVPNSDSRRKAYLADITYGTNNEFGFDYLRDNMAKKPDDIVQRKHHFSIVDEVDSVLIDDARTPLIISGPTPRGDIHEFNELKHKIEQLVSAQKKYVTTVLSDSKKLLQEGNSEDGGFYLLRSFRGLPKNKALIKFLSEDGIRSQLQKTENFYMQEKSKNMHKVDEDLFFTIDEKNNSIELTDRGIDVMTGNSKDKNFFIMPDVGGDISILDNSNLSEKEKSDKRAVLMRDFSIKSERIHTVNQLLKAYTLFEKDVEYVVMENKVKIVDEQTGRIMDGRRYSDGLHQAIEAKENVKIEASTQTFATITLQNYFRMYNKLAGMTGTAETEAGEFWEIYKLDVISIPTNRPVVRDDKDDLVYKTDSEKYNAIVEEIVKLTEEGRPVLVGTTSVEISELLGRILKTRGIKHNILNAKLHQREADIVAEAGKASVVTIATNMAGRGTDIKLSDEVKEAGGLAIIGSERHDSRRVDRQLRGRSGRQGDPGSSRFFVSLEDKLMRLFGSERIAKLMDRMGLEEGEVISHSMVNKSIERAQKKVEENNFGTRKRLLEYDDVMNKQREIIYTKRKHALFGERLSLDVTNMIYDTCFNIVNQNHEFKDFHTYKRDVIRVLAISSPVNAEEFTSKNENEVLDITYNSCIENYKTKSSNIAYTVLPQIKEVFKNQSATYKNIVIPFTDGIKTLQVTADLEESVTSEGVNIATEIEKGVTLAIIDDFWKEHLREMDDLKQSVQNAVYEQKDPLLIYKFEAIDLFKILMSKINKDIISFLLKAGIAGGDQKIKEEKTDIQEVNLQTSRKSDLPDANTQNPNQSPQKQKAQPIRTGQKIERNSPCPCGSGKKYKKCHGR